MFNVDTNKLAEMYNEMIKETFYGKISKFITGRIMNAPYKLLLVAILVESIQKGYDDIVTCCEYLYGFSEYPILYRHFWEFGVKEDVMRYKEYEGSVDYLLFDTKCATSGGCGKHFDWSVLEAYDGNTPFLLSGGIGPEDIDNVKAFRHPMMAGIDLNSKFETEPGIKDIEKLKLFIRKIRNE